MGAPFESLKRGNIEDFIAYGFYCQRPDDLAPEVRGPLQALHKGSCAGGRQHLRALRAVQVRRQLSEYITRIEAVWGVHFEEGRTPGLRFMAHLWEDLRYLWKPLAVRLGSKLKAVIAPPHLRGHQQLPVRAGILQVCQAVRALQVHLAAEAMGLLTAGMLLALGFRLHREQGFTYWLRAPRARRAAAASLSSAGSSESAPAPSSAPSAASASPLSASPASSPVPSRPASPAPGSWRGSESAAGGLPPTQAVLAGAGLAAAEAAPVVFVHGVGLGLVRRPLLAHRK